MADYPRRTSAKNKSGKLRASIYRKTRSKSGLLWPFIRGDQRGLPTLPGRLHKGIEPRLLAFFEDVAEAQFASRQGSLELGKDRREIFSQFHSGLVEDLPKLMRLVVVELQILLGALEQHSP